MVFHGEALGFPGAVDQWTKVVVTCRCDLVSMERTQKISAAYYKHKLERYQEIQFDKFSSKCDYFILFLYF